jgi:hypothetical protein
LSLLTASLRSASFKVSTRRVAGGPEPKQLATGQHNVSTGKQDLKSDVTTGQHGVITVQQALAARQPGITLGQHKEPTGHHDVTIGPLDVATRQNTGQPNDPTGQNDVTIGWHGVAAGQYDNVATGQHGVTTGQHGVVTSRHNVAIGQHDVATGQHDVATGQCGVTTTRMSV